MEKIEKSDIIGNKYCFLIKQGMCRYDVLKIKKSGKMKTEKRNGVILFTIIIMLAGILLNILGKWFAVKYKLPFWMDAVGTGVTACLLEIGRAHV